MSGLGLLATAFGSYASTLGGLYKEQVEKEQAAQEKLAAEERQRAWEREKIAGERQFAIEMLQRKFDQSVQLMDKEHELQAKLEATKQQQDLERIGYAHKLKLEEQEQLKQIDRRDYLARLAIGMGLGAGKGVGDRDSREFAAKAGALTEQLRIISNLLENAGEEEKPGLLARYDATQRALTYLLENGEVPKGLSNVEGSFFVDPLAIVGRYANRPE